MDLHIFQDESGEFGYHSQSSRHMVITCLAIEDINHRGKGFQRRIRKICADMIKLGWNRSVEIKAHNILFPEDKGHDPYFEINRALVFENFLKLIVGFPLQISTIVIENATIFPHLRCAPYGVLYNYFSVWALEPWLKMGKSIHIIADPRNKQRNTLLDYRGYVYMRALELNGWKEPILLIEHQQSDECYGLKAVDLISAAIYRRHEHGDNQYWKVISGSVIKEQVAFK